MADDVRQNIENALNKIVNTTDQSGNMIKELKKTIFKTVSTLKNLFHKMKGTLDEKTRQNKQMEKEINTVKIELDAYRSATAMGHAETTSFESRNYQEPSVDMCCHSTTIIGSFTPGQLQVAQKGNTK
jgi:hypothetical protein